LRRKGLVLPTGLTHKAIPPILPAWWGDTWQAEFSENGPAIGARYPIGRWRLNHGCDYVRCISLWTTLVE